MIEVPSKGGSLTEGIIGSPRFINPILAASDADRDLTSLIFSGLLKPTPTGEIIPDMAESYTISDDGLIYTFKLKKDLYFHDGSPVSTDDIVFTIQKAQDPTIKSPQRVKWDGIIVKKINDEEISFTLKYPYYPFLENTTLGILPKHIWKDVSPEQFTFSKFNAEPIGSGPYKINTFKKNSLGIPEGYDLRSFNKYALGEPHIPKINIKFYPDEDSLFNAYNKNEISSMNSISPQKIKELKTQEFRIERTPLPRIFGVFFNQNHASIFVNKEVRMALDESIDREKIVNEILEGYATPIYGPVPTTSKYFLQTSTAENREGDRIENAKKILMKNGWKLGDDGLMHKKTAKADTVLQFTLSTSNAPELKRTAEMIKGEWEKIGAKIDLQIFETGDLNQNIIHPREYDALLFGEVIGRDIDLFAFWHSSQRNNPGLNIAMYANTTADKILESTRSISDAIKKKENYIKFQKELAKDVPAVFVYSPDFIYVIPKNINGFSIENITTSSERFLNIQNWYIKTEKIWKIFAK